MIPFEQAMKIVLEVTRPLPPEILPLDKLSGRILAESICTPFPLPRFDNTAVDGYAVWAEDFETASAEKPIPLTVTRSIRAGDTAAEAIKRGEAVRIMTGAPIPPGADAVIMREDVESTEGLYLRTPVETGANIRHRAEELPEGALVFDAGKLITPPVIGMLATLGMPAVKVGGIPRITFIVTGDELKQPGEELHSGQIYDSNGPALAAAATAAGIENVRIRRVKDQREELKKTIETSLADSDIVITLGGISVGDFDYVREVNAELGIHEYFWRVAMKPGKPTYFGEVRTSDTCKLVFGLPGNPVAALVTFQMLVKPAIRRMSGFADPVSERLTAKLMQTIHKKEGRAEFVRGFYSESLHGRGVTPVKGQESHMVSGLAAANCLIFFPREEFTLPAGSDVEIIPLHWN